MSGTTVSQLLAGGDIVPEKVLFFRWVSNLRKAFWHLGKSPSP